MLRSNQLVSKPQAEMNWDLRNNNTYDLLFEAHDKKNNAGFHAFGIYIQVDNKINCVLYIKDDKIELGKIEKEIAQAIADNSGFFQTFKLAQSIKKSAAVCGYMLSTQDQKMADIMLNYVDQKLKFTSDHYNSLKNMITEKPANEPSTNRLVI